MWERWIYDKGSGDRGYKECRLVLPGLNLAIKSGIWRERSTQRVILHCATLGGGGAVLSAFTLWSVRWKADQRRSNRCFFKTSEEDWCIKPISLQGFCQ